MNFAFAVHEGDELQTRFPARRALVGGRWKRFRWRAGFPSGVRFLQDFSNRSNISTASIIAEDSVVAARRAFQKVVSSLRN